MADKNGNISNGNSGNYNSGDSNSGSRNSGDFNSGSYNSGNGNSGSRNSSSRNSGDSNSGDSNSGNFNSGYFNSGNGNSGSYNSGYGNSGYFNTGTPKVIIFNKETNLKIEEIDVPYIILPVSEFIFETNMTSEEKTNNPLYRTTGGYVKKLSYKDAWKTAWGNLKQDVKDQFTKLPNFDADIFLEITGIDLRSSNKTSTCDGKVVEIDGKKYKLTEI